MTETINGHILRLPHFKGRVHANCDTPDFLEAISDCRCLLDSPQSEILLESRNRVGAVSLSLRGQEREDVIIKEFRSRGLAKWKNLLFPSKAFKAWQGAWALVNRGIGTPLPLAYLERKKRGCLEENFFIAEKISTCREVRFLFRELSKDDLQRLLSALAHCLSFCHERGIFHRDLSDGNILVKREAAGKFQFYFLDTNRIRLRKKIGVLGGIKNLVRLGVPPDDQLYFLAQYLKLEDVPIKFFVWYRINKSFYAGLVKLKKKLRLRKWARQLRIQ
ncbi:MAG: lipopolysaccharide kinase InaA family protein [Candidatus Aminicenantales bacterium]